MIEEEKQLQQIIAELECVLAPLIAGARTYFGNDQSGYYKWICKASTLKLGAPTVPFEELTPERMARPLAQVFQENYTKK